ncbi:MAG: hypothetical protein VYC11_05960, partial [Candidatus Thermoplasmatota archaeon]|nr:hypothetical protein [Candidatus Thermoplasmatota archaeon]
MSTEDMSPQDAASDVSDVLAETVERVERKVLPHDRKRALFGDDGASDFLLNSARRWVATLLAD